MDKKDRTKIIMIVSGVILILALFWLDVSKKMSTSQQAPTAPDTLSVEGLFGYKGEEEGVPTTLVLIRIDQYHRILIASSGTEGAIVTQVARFSATATSLQVTDLNGDQYEDVITCGLILYGAPGGLVLWETTQETLSTN